MSVNLFVFAKIVDFSAQGCIERRFNIYSIIWRYLQIFEDIFKWIKDIFKSFEDIFNSYEDIFKWFEDIFKSFADIFKWIEDIFKWYYL